MQNNGNAWRQKVFLTHIKMIVVIKVKYKNNDVLWLNEKHSEI